MSSANDVLRLRDVGVKAMATLLSPYGLQLVEVAEGEAIPGSFWGEDEAGLVGAQLLARQDTPIHSILHESCHYICMDGERRAQLHTNAGGDTDEENAVCYLQILLAERVPGMGQARMWADMDRWGYSFRLGSAQQWFKADAVEARDWLLEHGLIQVDSDVCLGACRR